MRGLANLPQNIVGGIGRIVDGPLIQKSESLHNFARRPFNRDVAQHARGEARTVAAFFNRDGDARQSAMCRQFGRNRLERYVIERGRLARHAVMIHGIRTIGADLSLKNRGLASALDALDGNPNRTQIVGKGRVIDLDLNEIADPVCRKLHENQLLALSC